MLPDVSLFMVNVKGEKGTYPPVYCDAYVNQGSLFVPLSDSVTW